MAQFSLTTTFDCPATDLRSYLSRPANLPLITDPEIEIEVLESPEVVTEGKEIEFSVLIWGFRQKMRHRWITATDDRIVAEQVEGPTQAWRHEQQITSTADGCSLTETILFEPPGGMMGQVITEDAIAQSLAASTTLRHELLAKQLA